jgi:SAM-dependent methyltransferase
MSDNPTSAPPVGEGYFAVMGEFAERHWWYRARRDLVRAALATHARAPTADDVAVDVGCGSGEMIATLRSLGYGRVAGTEISHDARHLAVTAGLGSGLIAADARWLPFPDDRAACVTSMDVIEHVHDAERALREFARVTAPGGTIVITAPAYRWLWSEHDVWAGHARRYSAAELASAAERAGIAVERATYFHSLLLPAAVLLRKTPLRRLVKVSNEQMSYRGATFNRIFGLIAAAERAVLARSRIPFGLSVLLVGRMAGSVNQRRTL